MTDNSREARLTAKLHRILPIYSYMQLSVEALGNPIRCTVPLSHETGNHFGVMHAGVLFSLAEATAGLAVTQHREFAAMLIVAEKVSVEYRRPARSAVTASVGLSDAFFDGLRAALADNPRHRFDIPVELADADGKPVCRCLCSFQLRKAM